MPLTAAELRKRAREDLREVTRRREAVAVAAVNMREAAERARADAASAAEAATEALAAASVTFGGPENAARVTGIPANELRAARREVSAEKAAEVVEVLLQSRRGPRRSTASTAGEPGSVDESFDASGAEPSQAPADQPLAGARARPTGDGAAATGHSVQSR